MSLWFLLGIFCGWAWFAKPKRTPHAVLSTTEVRAHVITTYADYLALQHRIDLTVEEADTLYDGMLKGIEGSP